MWLTCTVEGSGTYMYMYMHITRLLHLTCNKYNVQCTVNWEGIKPGTECGMERNGTELEVDNYYYMFGNRI